MISVITPTADRPLGFSLCERFMARQTVQPDEWIVADGGREPALCTMGQVQIHEPRPPGPENFARNLLNGIARAKGSVVVVMEDDDNYAPTHIRSMAAALEQPYSMIAGRHQQPYYHVGARCWRVMGNKGMHSSLCQTAMRRGAVAAFEAVVKDCLAAGKFCIDVEFWKRIASAQWAIAQGQTCIGIKGLPGQAGLGIGHRPTGPAWKPDPDLTQLRAWIGADADMYADYQLTGATL